LTDYTTLQITQVKEIVEGDFFQDLQSKARKMRADYSDQAENDK
jgi:hypothetical protein